MRDCGNILNLSQRWIFESASSKKKFDENLVPKEANFKEVYWRPSLPHTNACLPYRLRALGPEMEFNKVLNFRKTGIHVIIYSQSFGTQNMDKKLGILKINASSPSRYMVKMWRCHVSLHPILILL